MNNFKKLSVWILSMEVAKKVLLLIEELPAHKRFGLAGQLERSAVSIPSNIAEGAGRESLKEYMRFLNIAYSSSYELETQLLIAKEVDFFPTADIPHIIDELQVVQKMLYKLNNSIQKQKE